MEAWIALSAGWTVPGDSLCRGAAPCNTPESRRIVFA